MEKTPHILLAGPGANEFAKEMNVKFEDDAYFFTQHRYDQLVKARQEGVVELDHTADEITLVDDAERGLRNAESDGKAVETSSSRIPHSAPHVPPSKGTVGAVACDRDGNLAAATSTGGMTNKKFGRVGDTALIGAGTYADNSTCAVSCTGYGEFFMLSVTAYDIAARMKYKDLDLETAANEALEHLTSLGGDGGFIAVDREGRVVLPFNCEGMYRGYRTADALAINIYRD